MGGKWAPEKKLNWQRENRHAAKQEGICTVCVKKFTLDGKTKCSDCLEKARIQGKQKRFRVKLETFRAYGTRCSCCGEKEPEFLTIEHLNNDGGKQRKLLKVTAGFGFYMWLKKNKYPQDLNLTVRCFNCNCARSMYGECPHSRKEKNENRTGTST